MNALIAAIIVFCWVMCGLIAYSGLMAHEKVDPWCDQLCRRTENPAVCDDRLRTTRASFLVWGVVSGPFALVISAGATGFFHAGFALTNENS